MLYTTARIGLVLLWLAIAWVCLQRGRRGAGRGWLTCGALAFVFATIRATRWNWHLLIFARGKLRDFDVYSDRMWLKVTLAVLLIGVLWTVCWRARRWYREQPPGVRRTGMPLVLMGLFILVLTFSLDGFLPRFVYDQPGRYLLEYGLGLASLVLARSHQDRS
jgi:hypothetical protein